MLLSTIISTTVDEGGKVPIGISVIFVVLVLIAITIYLTHDYYETKRWKQGIFPLKLKYTPENLLKAYISLSANLIRRDIAENAVKSDFSINYLKKEFSNCKEDIQKALKFSIKYPIQLNTVCQWINENVKEDFNRLQIIYFLTSQSMVHGKIMPQEYRFLEYLTEQFKLEFKDLDSIVASYYRKEEESKSGKTSGRKSRSKVNTKAPTKSKVASYYKVLGISENATMKEVKKAYRKLAMQHHPDKFANAGAAEISKAQARFLKIQEAYEYLERISKK